MGRPRTLTDEQRTEKYIEGVLLYVTRNSWTIPQEPLDFKPSQPNFGFVIRPAADLGIDAIAVARVFEHTGNPYPTRSSSAT